MRASKLLTEVVVVASIRIRNWRWDTVDISNMIVVVVSLLNLSYKLVTSHICTSVIVVKTLVSTGARFLCYANSFWHVCIILSIGTHIQLCNNKITLKY